MAEKETYLVEVRGVKRELPLVEVKPGLKIALLNILGDTEFVKVCAESLAEKLQGLDFGSFVTAEAKSIPLACAMAVEMDKPYIVLRKSYKPYMGEAISEETLSITTGKIQTLYLDEKDINLLDGKKTVVIDDVISTGSTLEGMRKIIAKANGEIAAEAAIFTEGDEAEWAGIIALGHLPLFFEG